MDYKPADSNREDKESVEKATAKKHFLTLLKTQVINQKSYFLLRDLLIEFNDMYEKYSCEVYTLASLVGVGLRDADITVAFV